VDNPFGLVRLAQDREYPPRWETRAGLRWRYAYARAAETRAQGEVGQDVLAFECKGQRLNFCLADGVSQSFFGDLAASALGDSLVRWLGALPSDLGCEEVRQQLDQRLSDLRQAVTEEVEIFPLPRHLPPMLLQVLEQKRQHGSESMFVCGFLEAHPVGRIMLAWLGDMRCRVWTGQQERPLGPGRFRTEDRWSSRRGPVAGPPQLWWGNLAEVDRLMVYSDGLAVLDDWERSPNDDELSGLIEAAGRSPTSDDISFLEVVPAG